MYDDFPLFKEIAKLLLFLMLTFSGLDGVSQSATITEQTLKLDLSFEVLSGHRYRFFLAFLEIDYLIAFNPKRIGDQCEPLSSCGSSKTVFSGIKGKALLFSDF